MNPVFQMLMMCCGPMLGQGETPKLGASLTSVADKTVQPTTDAAKKTDVTSKQDMEKLRDLLAKLKDERKALGSERKETQALFTANPSVDEEQLARLRLRLSELTAKLTVRGLKAPTKSVTPPPAHETTRPPAKNTKTDLEMSPKKNQPKVRPGSNPPSPAPAVDPSGLAQALFQAKDYANSYKAYRLIDQTKLKTQDRVMVLYMMACCLKKMGKLNEASTLYRKVATAWQNDILADCARWQLGMIQWRKDLLRQLQEIQKQRRSIAGKIAR